MLDIKMVAKAVDDTEDMKRVLKHFKLMDSMNSLTLTKGVSMQDVKVKTGQVQGFNHVLSELAHGNPNCSKFNGSTPQQRAQIQQWLQYAITLRGKSPIPDYFLKEVDASLINTTFLAGHNMTLADPVMFLSLYPTLTTFNFYEKEKYPNLSRWSRLLQNEDQLTKGLKKIVYSKTLLYNSISAHP